MNLIDQIAKATYDARMRSMYPGFDDRAPIHPRLGIGPVLTYEELSDEYHEKERSIAKAAIERLSLYKQETKDVLVMREKEIEYSITALLNAATELADVLPKIKELLVLLKDA